tara:strand:- start:63 stop:491 length:429 start_codon:yes stop_codon:yes gene_type:complete
MEDLKQSNIGSDGLTRPVRWGLFLLLIATCTNSWWGSWLGKAYSFPYEVESKLEIKGYSLSGENNVRCVLRRGDQLHHVAASDVDVPLTLNDAVRHLTDLHPLHHYNVVLKDKYSGDCALDTRGVLLLNADVDSAISRDNAY